MPRLDCPSVSAETLAGSASSSSAWRSAKKSSRPGPGLSANRPLLRFQSFWRGRRGSSREKDKLFACLLVFACVCGFVCGRARVISRLHGHVFNATKLASSSVLRLCSHASTLQFRDALLGNAGE